MTMDKQTIEQAAHEHAQGNALYACHKAAFIEGAEWATPKWISVNDGPPQPADPESPPDHIHCLVVYKGDITILAWNTYHVCWDDEDMDDYRCDLLDVTHYLPLDSLPNP